MENVDEGEREEERELFEEVEEEIILVSCREKKSLKSSAHIHMIPSQVLRMVEKHSCAMTAVAIDTSFTHIKCIYNPRKKTGGFALKTTRYSTESLHLVLPSLLYNYMYQSIVERGSSGFFKKIVFPDNEE